MFTLHIGNKKKKQQIFSLDIELTKSYHLVDI